MRRDPSSTPGPGAEDHRYDAFISYSHSADGELAPALQRGMQRLAKPWRQRRALEVFRDQTGLAVSPDLWQSIVTALDGAGWFVLLASPQAAASRWVGQEIEHCLSTKGVGRIVIVLTDGRLEWDKGAADFAASSTAVHPALHGLFPQEPRWIDLSWAKGRTDLTLQNPRFRRLVAELVAPMHGLSTEDLLAEDVRQQRRTGRVVRSAVAALTVAALVSGGAATLAVGNQREALAQQRTAEAAAAEAQEQRATAEQQARQALSRELAAHARAVATGVGEQAVGEAIDAGTTATEDAAPTPDRVLSLLLAAQAYTVADTDDAGGALLSVVAGPSRDSRGVPPDALPDMLPDGLPAAAVAHAARDAPRAVAVPEGRVMVVELGGPGRWQLPPGEWWLAPDGTTALSAAGDVLRLDDEGSVTATDLQLPPAAAPPVFDGAGDRALYPVADRGAGAPWTAVVVADLDVGVIGTHRFERPICEHGCWPGLLALSPDGSSAAVRTTGIGDGSTLVRLEITEDGPAAARQLVVQGSGFVRYTDDGGTVQAQDGPVVRRLDPVTLAEAAPALATTREGEMAFLSDERALVAAHGCDGVGVVDAATMAVTAEIPVPVGYAEGEGCVPEDGPTMWLDGGAAILAGGAVWPTDPATLVRVVCAAADRTLSAAEREQYLPDWYGPLACADGTEQA
ncbi:toll/interleukin-1 receptor domain-containing protein [Georgenia sp. 10Sc9-8]|uniref:Toll/interleukin-1 receptor domain-containing protein n=1 Tax=Georgenia halotolerans TaxID=3028317 RepID=A0ABT5U236_9MICO|nr:toll/interleukin-1 receptor domain-containing protein [Georgenia halotolerans]